MRLDGRMMPLKYAGFLLLAAVVLGDPAPPTDIAGFPQPGPIADADPSIRHPVTIHVPTKLELKPINSATESVRSPGAKLNPSIDHSNFDGFLWSIDQTRLEPVDISVGKNMVLGVKYEAVVYQVKLPRFSGHRHPR